MIATYIAPVILGVAAWFGVSFLGKPILNLREKRLEALQIAKRYSNVGIRSSDDLRETALKSLHDVGNALLAFSRENSLATRFWCWLMGYDLEMAAWCLFGLAEGARGEYSLRPDQHKNTLNAVYVSLAATKHLLPQKIECVKREIEQARRESPDG